MGILKTSSVFLIAVLVSACAHADPRQNPSRVVRGTDGLEVKLTESLSAVKPGSIVIIGENHNLKTHQAQQVEIMSTLRAQGHKVSVGMELFYYPQQSFLDSYRSGTLSEPDFLKATGWATNYEFYRDQVLFPLASEGATTWALNLPRTITGKISKGGLSALSPEDLALLPPQFQVGRDSYKERFLALMTPHLPDAAAGERYFIAHSAWDDTMAWRASEFMKAHPEQTLVIVVGEFHVQFGGGLPDRLKVRAPQIPVLTFSQFNSKDLSEDEVAQETSSSAQYGERADYIWIAPAE